MTHWNIYYDKFLKGVGQNWMSADIAYALAVKLLDRTMKISAIMSIKDVPTFVHMKSFIQNIPENKISLYGHNSITSDLWMTCKSI